MERVTQEWGCINWQPRPSPPPPSSPGLWNPPERPRTPSLGEERAFSRFPCVWALVERVVKSRQIPPQGPDHSSSPPPSLGLGLAGRRLFLGRIRPCSNPPLWKMGHLELASKGRPRPPPPPAPRIWKGGAGASGPWLAARYSAAAKARGRGRKPWPQLLNHEPLDCGTKESDVSEVSQGLPFAVRIGVRLGLI